MGGEESELGVVSPPQWKKCRCQRYYFSQGPAWLPASSSSFQMIDLKCCEETEQPWACTSRLESALCLAHRLLCPLFLVPFTTHPPPPLMSPHCWRGSWTFPIIWIQWVPPAPSQRLCSPLWGNSPQCPAWLPTTFQDCLLLIDDLIVPPKRRFFFLDET